MRPIWEQQGRYVRIVPQDMSTAPPNDQPASLQSEQVETVLGALQVEFSGTRRFRRKVAEDWQLPVFDAQESEVLGKAASLGLGLAGPRDDLVFLVTGDHDVGARGMFRKHDLNSGRIFYRGGRLNIIFSQVHEVYDPSAAGTLPASAIASRRPREDLTWKILKIPGVDHHRQDGGDRGDWVEIDIQAVLTHLGWTPGQMKHQGFVEDGGAADKAATEQGSRAVEGGGAVAAGATGDVASHLQDGRDSTLDVEGQLVLLKRLRDRGLISQEVYDARVKEILDRVLK